MLFGILVFLFLLVCVILVFLILIQDDKGGGISGAIGGGVSATANSLLGSQNAENILTRGTKIFAAVFFVLTVIITLYVARGNLTTSASRMVDFVGQQQQETAPLMHVDPVMQLDMPMQIPAQEGAE
jgi:preprotein translocase subunit SecG